jgi:hypothetical protein
MLRQRLDGGDGEAQRFPRYPSGVIVTAALSASLRLSPKW